MNHNPEKWFKHSIDSHNEPQMRRIKARFGKLNGYAMYYISIEIMMRSGGWIEHDDIEIYADDYGVDCDELERFFSYCVSIDAFILVDNKYSADTVQETLEKRKRISEVRSEAGAIGGKKSAQLRQGDPGPAPKPKKRSAKHDPDTPESDAVKAMIESIEKEIGAHPISNLSNEEMTKLKAKYGDALPKALRAFYIWKVSKNKKVKSDYLSMLKPWVEDAAKTEHPKPKSRKELLEVYSQ